jgi:hypothetical protein
MKQSRGWLRWNARLKPRLYAWDYCVVIPVEVVKYLFGGFAHADVTYGLPNHGRQCPNAAKKSERAK